MAERAISNHMANAVNSYYLLAKEISDGKMGTEYVYCIEEKRVYRYLDGIWIPMAIERFIDKINTYNPQTAHYTSAQLEEVIKKFKILKNITLDEFNKVEAINFENGMFDPLSNSLAKHKPEYYSTIRIPYKYNELAQCDLWVKTLLQIFEGNTKKIDLLQEFFGYCLLSDNEQKKGFLLLGETDTGKSTIIDTFREVVGDSNISNVPLHNLADQQHTPGLINKMVNIDPDVNKNAMDYEREFKIITGGKREKIRCSPKFVPTFEFTPKCKLILAANIFPKITDHSSAFYQRLLIVPCERRFSEEEKDRLLNDKLREELPGIFNWMIRGAHRLKERGSFERHDFMVKAVEELENDNNPSNIFFEEHVEVEIGSFVEKGELFEKYVKWAGSDKQYILSKSKFATSVFKKFGKYTPKSTMDHNLKKRVWRNIKYVHFKDDSKQDISWEPAVAVDKTPSPTTIGADSQQGIDWGRDEISH